MATFHELAPRLTRIEVNVDVEPGSLVEKFARGARHVKRAMRAADLHRFKAYIMMNEAESGEWRGTIEDAEVKSPSSSDDSTAKPNRTRSGQANAASSSSRRSRSSSRGRSRSSPNRAQRSGGSNGGDPSSRGARTRGKSGSRS